MTIPITGENDDWPIVRDYGHLSHFSKCQSDLQDWDAHYENTEEDPEEQQDV